MRRSDFLRSGAVLAAAAALPGPMAAAETSFPPDEEALRRILRIGMLGGCRARTASGLILPVHHGQRVCGLLQMSLDGLVGFRVRENEVRCPSCGLTAEHGVVYRYVREVSSGVALPRDDRWWCFCGYGEAPAGEDADSWGVGVLPRGPGYYWGLMT